MALPPSLLAAVEQHGCFSGCYSAESNGNFCVDPTLPTVPVLQVSCRDCLTWHVGVLASLVAPTMTAYTLADQLMAHVRGRRGYRWATGGYHTAGGGFWASAVCLNDGLYLVNGSRNSKKTSDVDVLVNVFRHGLAQPLDPRMLDVSQFSEHPIYMNLSGVTGPIPDKQALLSASFCSGQSRPGFHRVSIIEFLPLVSSIGVQGHQGTGSQGAGSQGAGAQGTGSPGTGSQGTGAQAVAPAGSPSNFPGSSLFPSTRPSPIPSGRTLSGKTLERQPKIGDVCPLCGAEVKERILWSGSFVGCLC